MGPELGPGAPAGSSAGSSAGTIAIAFPAGAVELGWLGSASAASGAFLLPAPGLKRGPCENIQLVSRQALLDIRNCTLTKMLVHPHTAFAASVVDGNSATGLASVTAACCTMPVVSVLEASPADASACALTASDKCSWACVVTPAPEAARLGDPEAQALQSSPGQKAEQL